tara:strand:+ start:712 stop:1713 length:1002 start_codon:yes stop_codon:yes gene_type:complete
MRVLFTCAGGSLMSNLFKNIKKNLRNKKIYIVGIDLKKIKKNKFLDNFYQVSAKNKYFYIKKLISICIREKINLIVPYSDQEAKLLSKNLFSFKKLKIKVMVNKYDKINIINNKFQTYEKLKSLGIRTPKYFKVSNKKELDLALLRLNFPNNSIVIKPLMGIGGRNISIIEGRKLKAPNWTRNMLREKFYKKFDRKKILNYLKNNSLMIMETLKEPAYDVDVFSLRNKIHLSVRKRINPTGIPYKGNIVENNNRIKNYCKKIARGLELKYLLDMDIMTDQKNKPTLLEINARPSGSIVASELANYPIFTFAICSMFNTRYFLPNLKSTKKIVF